MTGSMRFGANLREWRQRLRLTQDDLGQRVGSDGPRISRMENGAENPTLETIDKLGAALEIDVSFLHQPRPEEGGGRDDEPKGNRGLDQIRLRELDAEAAGEDTARGDILRAQHALSAAQSALNRALRRSDEKSGAA